jgi:hypothetical protein
VIAAFLAPYQVENFSALRASAARAVPINTKPPGAFATGTLAT